MYTTARTISTSPGSTQGARSSATVPGAPCPRRLAGEQHELPAAALAAHRDEGGGPGRVADLLHEAREVDRAGEHGVDHQPRLVELQVLAGDAELLAHEAPGAVGAEQVAGPHHPAPTGGEVADGHLHVVGVLLEAQHLVLEVHVDAGQPLDAGAEGPLQVGLVEHEARAGRHIEAHERLAVGVDEVHARHGRACGPHVVPHADLVEHPHDLGVDVGGRGRWYTDEVASSTVVRSPARPSSAAATAPTGP